MIDATNESHITTSLTFCPSRADMHAITLSPSYVRQKERNFPPSRCGYIIGHIFPFALRIGPSSSLNPVGVDL